MFWGDLRNFMKCASGRGLSVKWPYMRARAIFGDMDGSGEIKVGVGEMGFGAHFPNSLTLNPNHIRALRIARSKQTCGKMALRDVFLME